MLPLLVSYGVLRSCRLNRTLVLCSFISKPIHLFDMNAYMNINLYASALFMAML